ncbi:MAG: DUF6265 family protein [Bryobacteraceae bacterium]
MDIAQLVFMAGCWVNGPTEEVWLKPAGGSMLGISRTVKDGKTTFTEYMLVVEEEGTLVMKVQLRLAGKLTAFKLISLTSQEATFSNPEHDFPQRIIYRREPGGSLFARIEGTQNGKPAHEDYPMKRGRCD